jgi:hypothetical protein
MNCLQDTLRREEAHNQEMASFSVAGAHVYLRPLTQPAAGGGFMTSPLEGCEAWEEPRS